MRICEIIAHSKYKRTLITIAEKQGVVDYWWSSELEDGRQVFTMVVTNDSRQSVLDSLQTLFESDKNAKILVLPVDASIPRLQENKHEKSKIDQKTTREELYENVVKGVDLNLNFILMVIFSTIVVTIGLSEDNVAVVVGAMVIAPLLGPNIALSFAASIGNRNLILKSLNSIIIGILISITFGYIISSFSNLNYQSNEIISRTNIGMGDIVLALASGAAAALSMTTGISAALVGVMVSVALLPPAASFSILMANGEYNLAFGSLMLLVINTICVQLAGNIVFISQGIKARTLKERDTAKGSLKYFILFWIVSISILSLILYF
ncbi:TIGR00341 family protein [bacterium]|nr:TIGR00341 family protein [bacterium]|tara:strand:- start:1916 stop:2884 length:969 start_codon:yes stop_codon:yes gene_type:complete